MPILKTFCLLFTSYTPLWLSILFIDIKSIVETPCYVTTEWISITIIIFLLIVSFSVLVTTVSSAKHDPQTLKKYQLVEIQKQKSVTVEFILAFIVPLIAFDFTRWDGALLFTFLFCILSFLCMKHSFISVNILLEIAGYRYFTCKLVENKNTVEKVVISKSSLPCMNGKEILIKKINNEYAIHVENDE